MAFVLFPTPYLAPKTNKEKGKKPENRKSRQSMVPLASLWPGFPRPHATSSSAGITKKNSSKQKSKANKGKKSASDVTSTEVVEALLKPTSLPFMNSAVSVESVALPFRGSRRSSSDGRSAFATSGSSMSGRAWRSSVDVRSDGSWSTARGVNHPSSSFQDGDEEVVSFGRMSQPMQPKICPPATRARSMTQGDMSDSNAANRSSKLSASSISPVLSSFNSQIWPVYFETLRSNPSGVASRVSVVSPLAIDGSQSRRSYIPATATANRTPASELSQSTTHSNSSSQSSSWTTGWSSKVGSTPGVGSGYTSSFYSSPMSSRSAVVPGTPGDRPLPPNHPDGKAYDLISPEAAGVFDEAPSLKRMPTFRRKIPLNELRRKPLPPAPEDAVQQASGDRQAAVQPSMPDGQSADQGERPVFLPPKPLPSDLHSLDEAFRRSGLLFDKKGQRSEEQSKFQPPQQIRKQQQQQQLQRDPPQCPSLQHATEALKAQSTTPSSPELGHRSAPQHPATHVQMALFQGSTPAPVPKEEDASRDNCVTQVHVRRRTFDMDTLRELRAQAVQKVNANIRNARKVLPQDRQPSGSGSSFSPPSRLRNGPHNNFSNPALSEKVTRTLSFARSRKAAERNLRLRLPRLRTTDLTSQTEPKNLSVVVESPAELDGNSVKNTSTSPAAGQAETQSRSPPLEKVTEERPRSPTRRRSLVSTSILGHHGTDSSKNVPGHTDEPEIPASVARAIILRILQSVDNLEDLFNLAVINRAFYRVFKENELALMKATLFRMSPAAWELREMSPPWEDDEFLIGNVDRPVPEYTPQLYIRHYTRDLYTMIALKSLILVHCESFLRPDTARALAGLDEARSAEVDDAFWRVWTFCRIFGCGKSREEDIAAQADWLTGGRLAECESRGSSMVLMYELGVNSVLLDPPHGFSKGNGGGLNSKQLYDMMEIWTCLGVLLQVFHDKCEEARKYGVFDNSGVRPGDIAAEAALLEDWTQYLLTLGPSAILTLISLNPSEPVETMFARAQELGWTKWTRPTKAASGSCRWFLKEAISRAYEYHLVKHEGSPRSSRTPRSSHSSSSAMSRSSSTGKSSRTSASVETNTNRQRQAELAAELKKRKGSMDLGKEVINISSLMVPPSEERPLSTFEEVIEKLDGMLDKSPLPSASSSSHLPPDPPTPDRHLPKTAAVQPLATPPPPKPLSIPNQRRYTTPIVEEKISQGRHPYPTEEPIRRPPTPPPIIDPVDIALNKMVKELGFNEEDAKWALKYTDTGESLDVEAAIDLLLQKEGNVAGLERSKTTGAIQYETDLIWRPTWRWA
ncbi:hypothetical protein VTO42DRAFT_8063 [Malbranchea cinnamomea]